MNKQTQNYLTVAAVLSLSVCASTLAAEPDRDSEVRISQSLTNDGYNLMVSKDYTSARPYFEKALATEPSFAMAHLDLGVVYMNTGNPALATEQFQLAIANDTDANHFEPVRETTDGSTGTISEIANRNLKNLR